MMRNIIFLLGSLLLGVSGDPALGDYYKDVVREQHQVINEMNQNFTDLEKASEKMVDLGYYVGKHSIPPKMVKITKTVAVKVPVPYPVKVPHPVPVPVPFSKPVPVPVPTLLPVPETTKLPTTTTTVQYAGSSPRAFEPLPSSPPKALALEQESAGSHLSEQLQEYVHSFPIHSVYDAGDDYNPMEGNRLALAEHLASPSESRFSKKAPSSLQQLEELHYGKHPSKVPGSYQSSPYASSHPEAHPQTFSTSDGFKFQSPGFPRATDSPYPSTPVFSTKTPEPTEPTEPSFEHHSTFGDSKHNEYFHQPASPTAPSPTFPTIRDSYPRYEKPNFEAYGQKSHRETEDHPFAKGGAAADSAYHYEAPEQKDFYSKIPTASYHHSYTHHERPIEADKDSYHRPSSTVEPFAYYESTKPHTQFAESEFKSYLPNPSPVSEALSYLDGKEPKKSHQEYYDKPEHRELSQHYEQPKSFKKHKTSYATASPLSGGYSIPSDSHLYPDYHELPSNEHQSESQQSHHSFLDQYDDSKHHHGQHEHHEQYEQEQHHNRPTHHNHHNHHHHSSSKHKSKHNNFRFSSADESDYSREQSSSNEPKYYRHNDRTQHHDEQRPLSQHGSSAAGDDHLASYDPPTGGVKYRRYYGNDDTRDMLSSPTQDHDSYDRGSKSQQHLEAYDRDQYGEYSDEDEHDQRRRY